MKKVCVVCLVLLMFLASVPANAVEQAENLYENVSCYSLDAVSAILGHDELIENADSVLVYEKNSNTLMYAWNADEQAYPASLVKIMTALIVAEEGNMEEVVTVKESTLAQIPYDATTINLQPDEVISVQDLLYCMLVSSANDAAAVLADHIYGSQEAFVARMNEYAAQLGCTGTNFKNVHGLHDDEQYTTARDVGKILSVALDNPIFRTAFGTETYTVAATNKSEERHLLTGNYLMSTEDVEYYYDGRVTGGRTGVTTEGYRNIAVSAQSDTMELICVLLGSESTLSESGYGVEVFGGYDETSELLDMSFDSYQVAQVIYDEQVLTQMPVIGGDCDVVLGPNTSVMALLPLGAKSTDLTYRYPANTAGLNAPIEKGDLVSSVEVWYKTLCVAQAELYALNSVDAVQIENTPAVPVQAQKSNAALWIVLGVIGGVVLLVGIRFLNLSRHRAASKRSRRNRTDRRRSR